MWSALKSDLLDFVTTIQEDTSKTLSLVLGDEEVDVSAEEENLLKKWIADTKRSYETYANPLKERRAKEFDRYKKKFTLTSHANEIAEVLDEEPEVSRFYAELVPIQITPDEFWARLFFRLQLLTRTGNVNFEDDDEEEELTWEDTDGIASETMNHHSNSEKNPTSSESASSLSPVASSSALTPNFGCSLEEKKTYERKIQTLEDENQKLRNMLSSLTNRIAQLEMDVKVKIDTITQLQAAQSASNSSTTGSAANIIPASSLLSPDVVSSASSSAASTPLPPVHNVAPAGVVSAATNKSSATVTGSDSWSEISSAESNHTFGTEEEDTSRHGVGGRSTLVTAAATAGTTKTLVSPVKENPSSQQFSEEEVDEEEDGWN